MKSVFCSADVQSFRGSLFFQHQPTHRFRAATQAHAFLLNLGWLLCGICISVIVMPMAALAAADGQTNRIRIEYFRPSNPALLATYELAKEKRVLERLQEVFSPFRLPVDLTIKTGDCQGVSNAWYDRPAISICYEYLHEIMQSMPAESRTPEGIAPADAAIGQFFYVAAHEMGHAAFDLFDVPIFGNAEDAADQFAIYIMLHFGKEQARRLITGAAYSYKRYVMKSGQVTVPLAAFSEAHAAPAQRFYNLLCLHGMAPILLCSPILPTRVTFRGTELKAASANTIRSRLRFGISSSRTLTNSWQEKCSTRHGFRKSAACARRSVEFLFRSVERRRRQWTSGINFRGSRGG